MATTLRRTLSFASILTLPLLVLVLLYDLAWIFVAGKYQTADRIRKCATINFVTLVACMLTYLVVWRTKRQQPVDYVSTAAEIWITVPVLLVSVFDVAEIVRDEEIYLGGAQQCLIWAGEKLRLGSPRRVQRRVCRWLGQEPQLHHPDCDLPGDRPQGLGSDRGSDRLLRDERGPIRALR